LTFSGKEKDWKGKRDYGERRVRRVNAQILVIGCKLLVVGGETCEVKVDGNKKPIVGFELQWV